MEESRKENAPPEEELKRLRTFQGDVEELLKKDAVSLSSIATAESAKEYNKPAAPPPFSAPAPTVPKAGKTLKIGPFEETSKNGNAPSAFASSFVLICGIALIAVAIIGGGIFIFSRTRQNTPPFPTTETTTDANGSYRIAINEKETRAGFIKKIRDGIDRMPVTLNEIKPFVIRAGEQIITTPLFFELLGARANAALIRAFDAKLTPGIHAVRGTQLFLLIPVMSSDNAFDGMLAFEKTMLADLGPLFGINPRAVSSASTTKDAFGTTLSFKDTVIKNRDARAIFNQSGSIIFLYAFVDAQTLLITTNEDTLKALIGKASKGKLQ